MTKLSKFRSSSTCRHVTWVRFHWNYIFISNFSYRKARQLASTNVSALSEQNISQASYFENSLFGIKQLTMLFAAHEVLYWFRVTHLDITIQSNQSKCNSIKRSCAAGCQHQSYKCMHDWINSSHCSTIGTSARPNLAPTRFTTAVRTFALWWHSKGKYISLFIAETSIAETAAPNCPISVYVATCNQGCRSRAQAQAILYGWSRSQNFLDGGTGVWNLGSGSSELYI